MRHVAVLFLCLLSSLGIGVAATQPIYVNSSPVHIIASPQIPPQIDATAFVNQSEFEINDIYFTGLPYQTFNTRYFTNTLAGTMLGDMGFRFEYASGNTRSPMTYWLNRGAISGSTFLLVSATDLVSSGPIGTSDAGLVRLIGGNINLNRNSVRAGNVFSLFSSGFNLSETNYVDPNAVTDNYWGIGTNNLRVTTGFDPSVPGGLSSPAHGVVTSQGLSNTVRIPSFFQSGPGQLFQSSQLVYGNIGAFAYTNRVSPTSTVVQVIFCPTNDFFDSNITARAFWVEDFFNADDGATAVVEFSYAEYDIINQTFATNYFYVVDNLAFATNLAYAKNEFANTRRPNNFELTRANYQAWQPEFIPNVAYSPQLIFNSRSLSNTVPAQYSAFSATVSPITVLNGSGQNVYLTTDPTNYPGRIEINGDKLSLDQTRIRAESTAIIKTRDLASNKVAQVDAPYANFDLRTLQPQMLVSNFAPRTVQRLSGQISAWSSTWRNYESDTNSTNTILYHVLMVDHSLIANQSVVINEMALHATNLIIGDLLSVRKTMQLDSRGLDVTGGLTLPTGSRWANSNVVELYNFTNRGVINVSAGAFAGTDRPNPYDNYINSGTNNAGSHDIRTHNLVNSGCLQATAGVLSINADSLRVSGAHLVTNVFFAGFTNLTTNGFQLIFQTNVLGPKLAANSDIQITAGSMTLSNSIIQAGGGGGALMLSVSGELSDAGVGALNEWVVSGGFNQLARPASGSLFGTHVLSKVAPGAEVFHTWSAEDRGPTVAGYSNNTAIGRLTLDAGQFSLLRFAPGDGTNRALYVDYLELLNYATNVNSQLAIEPNFTIYFANANVEASKIDGAANGRLRWAKSFTGPFSSTPYTYVTTNLDGTVVSTDYVFNTALVSDIDLDSDGDGTVNGNDPTPIYTASNVGLKVLKTKGLPPQVLLQWNGLRGATNQLEYRTSLSSSNWIVLTNFVAPGPLTGPVTVRDFLPAPGTNAQQRIYRVSVFPP
jgi:hypothetical protein